MTELMVTRLDNRAVLALTGKDVWTFLQNLITNDMNGVSETKSIYSALLTAQGKFLHDFFILKSGDCYLLEVADAQVDDLIRRLTLYKLRADVTISRTEHAVFALFGDGAAGAAGIDDAAGTVREEEGRIVFVDPRLAALGMRIIADAAFDPVATFPAATPADAARFEAHRLKLGIPEGGRDIQPEKNFLLEANFEELNGVSFSKGCYVGQELTARTKYRGKIKKRLLRIEYDGALTEGDKILRGGQEIGEVRSFDRGQGMALIRLEALTGDADTLEPAGLRICLPDYLSLTLSPEGSEA